MPFILPDLDATTRRFMLEEFESDVESGRVYVSARALPGTVSAYLDAQRVAFSGGDTDSLSDALVGSGIFAAHQKDGKAVNVAAAAAALGDGQFIAYYVRAVCRRAIDEDREVEVFRGQSTTEHRAESEAAIGARRDPSELLSESRAYSLEPWKFSVGKVNSGLAVKLV